MGRWTNGAQKMRDAMDNACVALSDIEASKSVEMYPALKQDGKRIPAGTRINWNGWLKQATVDLWDTEENDPDHAPTLWVKINYKDGVRVIPDVILAAEAFALDELGWWKGNIYKSLLNSNVYTPEQYAAGWELQE